MFMLPVASILVLSLTIRFTLPMHAFIFFDNLICLVIQYEQVLYMIMKAHPSLSHFPD